MFETLSVFTAFYFSLAAFIRILILFEKPLIELEEKYDRKRKNKRK